jgi:type II secretory pathway pseudopilin PulG
LTILYAYGIITKKVNIYFNYIIIILKLVFIILKIIKRKGDLQMTKRKGISLIVLVITIIVIIILAGAVILSLASNNPIAQSREAAFKTNVSEYNAELTMVLTGKYLADYSFDPTTFDAGVWNGTGNPTDGTIKEFIQIITEQDAKIFEIQDSRLVYVGNNDDEREWVDEVGTGSGSQSAVVPGSPDEIIQIDAGLDFSVLRY